LIICPACGSTIEGDLRRGCSSCGARAIGPPLARPEHELPSYGRASIAFASGVVMSLGFLVSTIAALVENNGLSLRFWNIRFWTVIAAGETAAWRLKWMALPVAIAVLWSCARIIRSIKTDPKKFIGLRAARIGFTNATVVAILFATLIGITVPARLRQRRYGIDAKLYARGRTLGRALLEYRALHGTVPPQEELAKELRTLPDPDGLIAEALRDLDPSGYQASAVLASQAKPTALRGGALRNASVNTTAGLTGDHGIAFTNYDLRLPGEDKILNTDDDLIIRDGLVMTITDCQAYFATCPGAR
jgi:hypothetical protein